MVRAIIELGHALDRKVVAEGIEDEATFVALRELGCDTAQGFWLSKPLPYGEVSSLVETWPAPRPQAQRLRSVRL